MKTQEWIVLHFTFLIVLSFHALLSTDWVSLNFQKWMILHFAFYTLLHPMGHNYSIGFNKNSRVKNFTFYIVLSFHVLLIKWLGKFELSEMDLIVIVLHFTFYIVLSVHALLSTDWVSLNFQKWMLLHFAFYTLLHPMGHNYSIGFNEDSRVNDFKFYILHRAICSCVFINWLGKLELLEMDAFTFCVLHLATSHGSQLLYRV